jgi:hypothetical protein
MRDATNIKDKDFYIDGVKTKATNVWITERGEIFVSLKAHGNCELNISAKDLKKYTKK